MIKKYVVSVTANSDNTGFKITVLLGEYNKLSAEFRTFGTTGIICICISVLISAVMMIAAFFCNQYILFLISPALSLFFVVIPMALAGYLIHVGFRLNDIEDSINELIGGEPTMYWKRAIGNYLFKGEDEITKRIGKYWRRTLLLGIITGIVPVVISLWLGINWLSSKVGLVAWIVAALYGAITVTALYLAFRFFVLQDWEKE
jgi:hypothetical protein